MLEEEYGMRMNAVPDNEAFDFSKIEQAYPGFSQLPEDKQKVILDAIKSGEI